MGEPLTGLWKAGSKEHSWGWMFFAAMWPGVTLLHRWCKSAARPTRAKAHYFVANKL